MMHRVLRRHGAAAALALTLLIAACGSDDGSLPTSATQAATGDTGQTTVATAGRPATTEAASSGPALVCEDPQPTEIGLGTPVDFETTDSVPTLCFWIEIPDGLGSIAMNLSGLGANLELAAGYGFVRTVQFHTGEFWDSREDGTAAEAIVLQNPASGPYFLTVGPAGFGDISVFQLLVTSTPEMNLAPTGAPLPDGSLCAPPATEVAIGASTDGEVMARDTSPEPRAYFCVEVPAGVGTLTIAVSELSGDLEMFVTRPGTSDFWSDRSRGGIDRSVVIEGPEPGAYHIEIAGAYQGAASTFTVTISG